MSQVSECFVLLGRVTCVDVLDRVLVEYFAIKIYLNENTMSMTDNEEDQVLVRMDLEEPSEEVMEYARKELNETPEVRKAAVEEFRKLIEESGMISRTDDKFLIRFLRPRRFDVNKALELLQKYFEFREANKSLWRGVNPRDLIYLGEDNVMAVPPYRDQDGHRIMIFRIGNWQTSSYSVDELFKAALIVMELGVLEPKTQIKGGVAIFDMGEIGLSHAWKLTPSVAKRMVDLVTYCFPMRFQAFHIINQPFIFNMIFAMFSPLLDERMKRKIFFHGSDMDSLHNHIQPKYLPEVYGGTRQEYSYKEWLQVLEGNQFIIQELNRLGYHSE